MIAWLLGAIVAAVTFTLERFFPHAKAKHSPPLVSFSAGVAITYLLLFLLPETYSGLQGAQRVVLIAALASFTLIYLLEKHIYLNVEAHGKKRIHEFKHLHLAFFFFYMVSVGATLFQLAQKGTSQALLFFAPVLLYAMIELLPEEFRFHDVGGQALYSAAPLYGVLLASLANFSDMIYIGLRCIVAGAVLYLVTREAIPPERRNRPWFFVLGCAVYVIAVFAVWSYGG